MLRGKGTAAPLEQLGTKEGWEQVMQAQGSLAAGGVLCHGDDESWRLSVAPKTGDVVREDALIQSPK